jgi:transposase-like protein
MKQRQRGHAFEEIRHKVAQEALGGAKTGYLARKYGCHPESVRKWTREYKAEVGVETALNNARERIIDTERLEELELNYARALKALGEKELELEILRELVKKKSSSLMKN